MMKKWCMTGFGLGLAPVASGTFGSAGACAIALAAWGILHSINQSLMLLNAVWVVLIILACIGCVVWGPWAVEYFAAQARKEGDPGAVVLDEFAGQWVSILAFPMTSLQQAVIVLTIQFFLFRLFDVWKLPPARQLERLPAGWGILLDDLAAGVFANIVGQFVLHYAVARFV